MSREAYIRATVAVSLTRYFSGIVRNAFISDPTFTREFGVKAEAVISLNGEMQFQRSELLGAVRAAFAPERPELTVADTTGASWTVKIVVEEGRTKVALVQGQKRLWVLHFSFLSPEPDVRVRTFEIEADRVHLPNDRIAHWKAFLNERMPDDDELATIQEDLADTPISVEDAIRDALSNGVVSLEVLVPHSERYYERLVGKHDAQISLDNYISEVAVPHMAELLRWHAKKGIGLAILLGSQPNLSTALGNLNISEEIWAELNVALAKNGDALSRAAAAESGLRNLQPNQELEQGLKQLIERFIADAPTVGVSQFNLLSALFLAIYGQMAHCRIFASKPAFWRKLAALAQAAMAARSIVASDGDAAEPVEWLSTIRIQSYLLQCFVDLRTEPRWVPELGLADQIRNELYGRVWMAATANADIVSGTELGDMLLGTDGDALKTKFELARAFLPGPLEGGSIAMTEINAENLADIHEQLMAPTISAESFSGLVNAAALVRLPPEVAELAADAIARVDYRIPCPDKSLLVPYLLALATVSAVLRSQKLADTLFTLMRTYRAFHPDDLSIEDSFRIAMLACASRPELMDWCKCVGDCVNDLAFARISAEEAERLYSHLTNLCHLVPELWSSCGQAVAALRSLFAR